MVPIVTAVKDAKSPHPTLIYPGKDNSVKETFELLSTRLIPMYASQKISCKLRKKLPQTQYDVCEIWWCPEKIGKGKN